MGGLGFLIRIKEVKFYFWEVFSVMVLGYKKFGVWKNLYFICKVFFLEVLEGN